MASHRSHRATSLRAPASLAVERGFPGRVRSELARDLVEQQLEELNGLGDRLRLAVDRGDRAQIERLRRRCLTVVEAMAWTKDLVLAATWPWAAGGGDMPEDSFGPAVVLLALEGDRVRVAAWLDGVDPGVRHLLAASGLDTPAA